MARMMTLRKLNESGVDRFLDFCNRKRNEDHSLKPPFNLIQESETSEDSGLNIEIDTESIKTPITSKCCNLKSKPPTENNF